MGYARFAVCHFRGKHSRTEVAAVKDLRMVSKEITAAEESLVAYAEVR